MPAAQQKIQPWRVLPRYLNLSVAGRQLRGRNEAVQVEALAHYGAHVILAKQRVHKCGELRGGCVCFVRYF